MKNVYGDEEKAMAIRSGGLNFLYRLMRMAVDDPQRCNLLTIAWRNMDDRFYKVCLALWKSKNQRSRRLRKKLNLNVVSGSSWFLTFTFRDSYLDGLTPDARRRYVRRWLNGRFGFYVANKDFGSDFGREHYHAVVSDVFGFSDTLLRIRDNEGHLHNSTDWPYGYSNWETIGRDDSDVSRIAKYIAKLQNHSLKATASKERMIFSRK